MEFVEILADPDDDYALKFERMTSNTTENSELFEEGSKVLHEQFNRRTFIDMANAQGDDNLKNLK